MRHRKIKLAESRMGKDLFADYFHLGEVEGPEVPLIFYVGGALTRDEYDSRRDSVPEPAAAEFERASAECGVSSADLLVIPCPVFKEEIEDRWRDDFKYFAVFELLPETDNPRPARMAAVGFSLGAFFAACLSLDLPRSRALAMLGGTGMAAVAVDSEESAFQGKAFKSWATANDPMVMESYKLLHALVSMGMDMDIELGPGKHAFEDYRKAGYVKDAFKFALERALA